MEHFRLINFCNTKIRFLFFILVLVLSSFCFQTQVKAEVDTSVLLTEKITTWE